MVILGKSHTVLNAKRLFCVICLSLSLVWVPAVASADQHTLAIVTVAGKKGVPGIFQEVIDGAKKNFKGRTKNYSLKRGFSESKLMADLKDDGIDAVLVLGGTGRSVASAASKEYPVIMGVVSSIPMEGVGGVVLQPSSEVVVEYLHQLAPDLRALHLIYDPNKHQGAQNNTEKAGKRVGINVMSYASSQSKQTQQAIESTLSGAQNARSAIWVMVGTKFDTAIKESLIKNTWGLPVFPFHYTLNAKDIELFPFVLLPDWQGMGQQLATMASDRLNGKAVEVAELKTVKLWVNQKKSRHFGLNLDGDVRKKIDYTLRD